jgi:hypothetical protein
LLGTVVALAIGVFVLAPMVRSSCESLPTSC